MKATYLSTVLLFIILTSLLFSQSDQQNKFTLSNNGVYAPGDSISVALYAPQQMKSFTFRLFRLEDPVELLKSGSSSHLSRDFDIWGKEKTLLAKYFSLQKEWGEVIKTSKNQYENRIQIGELNRAGIYLLQALRDDQVAYCPIVVTNYALIYKYANRDVLAFLTDAKTGAFIPETEFNFYSNDTLFNSGRSGKDGLLSIEFPSKFNEQGNFIVTAKVDDEIVFSNPYFFWGEQRERYTSYVYTNQPVYRPEKKFFSKVFCGKRMTSISLCRIMKNVMSSSALRKMLKFFPALLKPMNLEASGASSFWITKQISDNIIFSSPSVRKVFTAHFR